MQNLGGKQSVLWGIGKQGIAPSNLYANGIRARTGRKLRFTQIANTQLSNIQFYNSLLLLCFIRPVRSFKLPLLLHRTCTSRTIIMGCCHTRYALFLQSETSKNTTSKKVPSSQALVLSGHLERDTGKQDCFSQDLR